MRGVLPASMAGPARRGSGARSWSWRPRRRRCRSCRRRSPSRRCRSCRPCRRCRCRIGGLPIVSQPIDIPLPVPPLPVDVPLPVDRPAARCLRSRSVPSAPLSTSAFPGLDGLPVPLSADGLAAAAAADGEQLAPDGASAGTPAEGFPDDTDLGFAPAAGNRREPTGNALLPRDERERRLRLRVPERARQPAPSVTKRAAQTTERVEVAGISLARTGVAVLGLVAVAAAAAGGRRVVATAPPATRRDTCG